MVVVHNGIVENFLELRDELSAEGVEFKSETDTETIVHLVEHYWQADLTWSKPHGKPFNRSRAQTWLC